MTDDIYTKVLEWGEANPGFSLDAFKEEFPEEFDWIGSEILYSRLFTSLDNERDIKESLEGENPKKYYLTFEDAFRLLEVKELRESRKSATQALWVATIANVIAVAALLFTIYQQYFLK